MKKWLFKMMLSIIFVLFITCNAISIFAFELNNKNTQDTIDKETKEILEKVEKYLIVDGTRVYFNYDLAKKENENEEVINLGLGIENFSNLYNDDKFTNKDFRSIKVPLPIWGRDCWPSWSGSGFSKEPIDILDEGCRQHDLCFKGIGYKKNCECNKELVSYIKTNFSYMNISQKAVATHILGYFMTAGNLGCD